MTKALIELECKVGNDKHWVHNLITPGEETHRDCVHDMQYLEISKVVLKNSSAS
jgi:hypothetical protein